MVNLDISTTAIGGLFTKMLSIIESQRSLLSQTVSFTSYVPFCVKTCVGLSM